MSAATAFNMGLVLGVSTVYSFLHGFESVSQFSRTLFGLRCS